MASELQCQHDLVLAGAHNTSLASRSSRGKKYSSNNGGSITGSNSCIAPVYYCSLHAFNDVPAAHEKRMEKKRKRGLTPYKRNKSI